MQHLHLQEQFLDQSVFPDAKPVPAIDGLVNTLAWCDDPQGFKYSIYCLI